MAFSLETVLLVIICDAFLAQAQECPFTALVSPSCASNIPPGNWSSCLSAEEIRSSSVVLSWTPHPDIPPTMQRSYELYWRRRNPDMAPMPWKKTPRLEETQFNETSNRLSYTFEDLALNRMFEMRMCLSPTPQLPIDQPPTPQCGYCTLRFNSQSMGSTLALLSATMQVVSNEMVLICEASGDPLPMITWDARLSGERSPLMTSSNNYEISQEVDSNTVESRLSFDLEDVRFTRPECLIKNGVETLRVRVDEFEMVAEEATTMMTDAIDLRATVELPAWAVALLVVLPTLSVTSVAVVFCVVWFLVRRRKLKKMMAQNCDEDGNCLSRQPRESNNYSNSVPLRSHPSVQSESSLLYGPLERTLPKEMIIPSSDVAVSTVIGQGQFGVVYKGTLSRDGTQELVAVKTLKGIFATSSDIQSFTEEILILQQFDHPNVMSLIGVCLGASKSRGGPSIILPFMSKGSLLNFLRKEADRLRPSQDTDVTQIGAVEKSLVQICVQIAKGMEYLASQKFVHRDLAARNCMIDQNDQIRVGDFGLTEDIYARNYFRQASSDGVKLPVKWMSPESLKLGFFSEKSDVWSYGVTCWEVFSCGEIPYPGIHPQEVLPLLERGQRLNKPNNPACSDQLYSILLLCWDAKPEKRMTFKQLCITLESLLGSLSDYLDLNVLGLAKAQSSDQEHPYSMASEIEGTVPEDIGEVPQGEEGVYDKVADDASTNDHEVEEDSAYIHV